MKRLPSECYGLYMRFAQSVAAPFPTSFDAFFLGPISGSGYHQDLAVLPSASQAFRTSSLLAKLKTADVNTCFFCFFVLPFREVKHVPGGTGKGAVIVDVDRCGEDDSGGNT